MVEYLSTYLRLDVARKGDIREVRMCADGRNEEGIEDDYEQC